MSEDLTNRKRSVQTAAAGGALFGAGTAGHHLLNARLKAAGHKGPFKAAYATVRGRKAYRLKAAIHGPDIAGRLGARGLQAAGLPLAAYGAYNAIKRKPAAVAPVDAADLAHDVARRAVYADQVERGHERVKTQLGKAAPALSEDQRKLQRRRAVGRTTSLVGGTLGLGALALRAPSAAKVVSRRVPSRALHLQALTRREAAAVRHSNTLGVAAIGTGSLGSFNYASQQKLERKAALAKADEHRRHPVSGGALAGVGAATAGVGLVGGGIPGVKANPSMIASMHKPGLRGAGAGFAAGRGGIFGYRTVAHQGFLREAENDKRYYADKPANRAERYARGVSQGKIKPEKEIIRHLRRGRAASAAALAGGTAATVFGLRRAQGKPALSKAREDLDTYSGALLGGGATLAAASHGGSMALRGQAKRWTARGRESSLASRAIIPDPAHMPGKRKAQAEAAGALRGDAAQAKYFARVYRHTARSVGRLRNPALAVAGAGAAGLLAPRGVARAKEQLAKDDRFLRSYRERISPQAEAGYRNLKSMRLQQREQVAGSGAMAGLGGWLTHHEIRHRSGKAPATIAAVGTAASALNALHAAQGSRRLTRKIEPIKAKARSRRAQGLYGPGRGLTPVDMTSARAKNLAKAAVLEASR